MVQKNIRKKLTKVHHALFMKVLTFLTNGHALYTRSFTSKIHKDSKS
jgi:hypothetical protein